MVRQPAVAGKFYTSDPDQLREEVTSMVPRGEESPALGIIAPHAGYVYSGKVAGRVYGAITVPDAVLVLGPNHTGMGEKVALAPPGEWLTPLGPAPVNEKLSRLMLQHAAGAREDVNAHRFEHSLEVQLPFLQYKNPNVSIAALCLSFLDFDSVRKIGEGVARAISQYGAEVLIVASSDMTHYESASSAKGKDDRALAQIAALNPEGLMKVCLDNDITMCGVIPAAIMLVAAKALGATSTKLITYATSGEVNGDLDRVVAYAAVTVS
jgi:MEMO1 family protein